MKMKYTINNLEIPNVSSVVELTCIQTCADCPMLTEDWDALSKQKRCADNIWIPARHRTEPGRDSPKRIEKPKALREFLRELGLL